MEYKSVKLELFLFCGHKIGVLDLIRKKIGTMHAKTAEIKKALENGCPQCALALALTLPDICGKIAYPEQDGLKNSGKRYVKWCDEYVTPFYMGSDQARNGKENYLNGYALYCLRCEVLHSGDFSLENLSEDKKKKSQIEKLKFHFDKNSLRYGWHDSIQKDETEDEQKDEGGYTLDIDLVRLCNAICQGANLFCDLTDTDDITDSIIEDISFPAEKFEKLFTTDDGDGNATDERQHPDLDAGF